MLGKAYILDPIEIKGDSNLGEPRKRGIFADTSYADLPTAESDSFELGASDKGYIASFGALALIAAGLYIALK